MGEGNCKGKEKVRRGAVGKMWNYMPGKKRKKREGNCDILDVDYGGGPGNRTAPVVAVEWQEWRRKKTKTSMKVPAARVSSERKLRKKISFVGKRGKRGGGCKVLEYTGNHGKFASGVKKEEVEERRRAT